MENEPNHASIEEFDRARIEGLGADGILTRRTRRHRASWKRRTPLPVGFHREMSESRSPKTNLIAGGRVPQTLPLFMFLDFGLTGFRNRSTTCRAADKLISGRPLFPIVGNDPFRTCRKRGRIRWPSPWKDEVLWPSTIPHDPPADGRNGRTGAISADPDLGWERRSSSSRGDPAAGSLVTRPADSPTGSSGSSRPRDWLLGRAPCFRGGSRARKSSLSARPWNTSVPRSGPIRPTSGSTSVEAISGRIGPSMTPRRRISTRRSDYPHLSALLSRPGPSSGAGRGELDKAIADIDQALRLDPEYANGMTSVPTPIWRRRTTPRPSPTANQRSRLALASRRTSSSGPSSVTNPATSIEP